MCAVMLRIVQCIVSLVQFVPRDKKLLIYRVLKNVTSLYIYVRKGVCVWGYMTISSICPQGKNCSEVNDSSSRHISKKLTIISKYVTLIHTCLHDFFYSLYYYLTSLLVNASVGCRLNSRNSIMDILTFLK